MNADGTPVTEPRFINTNELVVSQDLDDCLGSFILLCFLFILVVVCYLPCLTSFSCFLCFARKVKDLQALVNEANKKVAAKKRRKNFQSLDHLIAGFGPASTSSPVVTPVYFILFLVEFRVLFN